MFRDKMSVEEQLLIIEILTRAHPYINYGEKLLAEDVDMNKVFYNP